jgi:hypothetical protein
LDPSSSLFPPTLCRDALPRTPRTGTSHDRKTIATWLAPLQQTVGTWGLDPCCTVFRDLCNESYIVSYPLERIIETLERGSVLFCFRDVYIASAPQLMNSEVEDSNQVQEEFAVLYFIIVRIIHEASALFAVPSGFCRNGWVRLPSRMHGSFRG